MIIYILLTLQVLDLTTTVIALRNPKLAESNGFLKPLMDKFGVLPALLVTKGAFIVLMVWAAPQVHVGVLYLLCAFYCWVVFNNIKLIRNT